ncbi:MAG: hypothetical protein D6767_05540, partial [Candidatus Hydrogenedentota bacterium]
IAFWGLIFYGILAVSLFFAYLTEESNYLRIALLLAVLGFAFDLFLFLYSVFVLGTVCNLCLLTYLVTLGILILAYLTNKKLNEGFRVDFSKLLTNKVIFIAFVLTALSVSVGTAGIIHASTKNENSVVKEDPDTMLMRARNLFITEFEKKPAVNINTADAPRIGSSNPVLTIIDFADFQCPFCKRMSEKLHKLLEDFPDWIQVIYKHYPLDKNCNSRMRRQLHEGSCELSYASYCAYKQNKFWAFHDLVYAKQAELHENVNDAKIRQLAVQAGLNPNSLLACMKDPTTKQVIINDIEEGNRLGVNSTPTIYLNNRKLNVRFMDFFLEQYLYYKLQQLQKH